MNRRLDLFAVDESQFVTTVRLQLFGEEGTSGAY